MAQVAGSGTAADLDLFNAPALVAEALEAGMIGRRKARVGEDQRIETRLERQHVAERDCRPGMEGCQRRPKRR